MADAPIHLQRLDAPAVNDAPTVNLAVMQQISRLNAEQHRLERASGINLAIGALIAVFTLYCIWMAFVFLGARVSGAGAGQLTARALYTIVGGVALVLLLQLLSFFFLRLYVSNQSDIKYFANEINNVETRYQAYLAAKEVSDPWAMGKLIAQMAQVERNVILKNDERMVFASNPPTLKDLSSAIAELQSALKGLAQPG